MNMNKKVISILITAAMMVCFCACEKDDVQPVAETATTVEVEEVKKGTVSSELKYTGEVKSSSNAVISPKVSGSVENIGADIGDYVEAGTVILTIDSTQYKQAYEQADAAYKQALAAEKIANASKNQAIVSKKQADAALKQANAAKEQAVAAQKQAAASKSSTEAAKENADASYTSVSKGSNEQSKANMNQAVANAQIAYDNALTNYNRQKALYESGAISKVALESAKSNLDTAEIALNTAKTNAKINEEVIIPQTETSAKTGVKQAEAGIQQANAGLEQANAGVVQADANVAQASAGVQQAEASIEQAEANVSQASAGVQQAKVALEIARKNLEYCYVKAPISGYIATKNVKLGQIVSAGMEIFAIQNSNIVDIEINVTESVISSVSTDTKAVISISAAGITDIDGMVTLASEVKDPATGMYTVKISVPNHDKKIKIGMIADVELVTRQSAEALVVPAEAVMEENDTSYVYVAQGNEAVKKVIVTGLSDGKITEVVSGLVPGEMVITKGKEFITEKNTEIKITQ